MLQPGHYFSLMRVGSDHNKHAKQLLDPAREQPQAPGKTTPTLLNINDCVCLLSLSTCLPACLPASSGGECGIVYERRMRMPTPASIPPSKRPEYYSYTIGPIAVVVLSTEQKFDEGSLQYK